MAGVISVIQLIHYPSFIMMDRNQFSNFHRLHTKALGMIAGPVMIIELVSAIWLAKNGSLIFLVNLVAVSLLWFFTFFVSVPSHNVLAAGFDQKEWRRLVSTNWFRTLLWWGRTLLLVAALLVRQRGGS